jgi:hypothetical protein
VDFVPTARQRGSHEIMVSLSYSLKFQHRQHLRASLIGHDARAT